jgi:hypothetical protein
MKFGICRVNDPVNSSTFGIVYRKACVLEFRYRKSLRHQLDELLSQGRIAPVNEKEHIPISSPIVLVSRRNLSI